MGQKQCGKCGEMVDEAKAFCPECGHAFDEEKKRTSVSDFDRSDTTVQLGATMFNQMLSDMGLSTSKEPNRPNKDRVEVISPAVPAAAPNERKNAPQTPTQSRRRTWIIAGVAAAVILFVLAALIIVAAFILYFRQTV